MIILYSGSTNDRILYTGNKNKHTFGQHRLSNHLMVTTLSWKDHLVPGCSYKCQSPESPV